jgi:chromosome segregation ATPase
MVKVKLLLWIAIILAMLLMAGCTGTKTALDTGHTGAATTDVAMDYHTKVNDLKTQIGDIRAMVRPDNNSTIDDYEHWLGQYRDRINGTWDQYNDTVKAGNAYLLQLANTSDEYRGVTSDLDVYKNDINGLESDYSKTVAEFETYKAKFTALNRYKDALNATSAAYNDLTNYSSNAKINSMNDYSTYISGFKGQLDHYDSTCFEAINAGRAYQQYCDPGSAEYAGIAQNEKALNDGINKAQASYNTVKADFENKSKAISAANDYTSKTNKVSAAKADLDKYDSATALQKLNYDYVIGYRQKVQAFDSLCNDAIASGNNCLQYLSTNSTQYKTVTDNTKAIGDAKAQYDNSLSKLITMYNNLHMLNPIK